MSVGISAAKFAEASAHWIVLAALLRIAGQAQAGDLARTSQSEPPIAAATASFKIHNLLPDFWRFWTAAHGQSLARQAQLWQELYVGPHQTIFDDLAAPCKPEFDAAW